MLVDGLSSPWELAWGPDGWLWVTERAGRRVVRINPSDAERQVALELDEVRGDGAQDGLLGMALHPQLLAGTAEDFVYVAYSYDAAAGRRFKIRRYTYDAGSGTLGSPLDVLAELPASSDHNGGRLLVGPDRKLYYTIGDQGANQFDLKCNLNRAQDVPGKNPEDQFGRHHPRRQSGAGRCAKPRLQRRSSQSARNCVRSEWALVLERARSEE